MNIIDTHTHFYSKSFDNDRSEAINRAFEAGVFKMIVPCCDVDSMLKTNKLCNLYPGRLFPAFGLHPEDITDHKKQLDEIFLSPMMQNAVAIGEVGIDLYWKKDNLDIQSEVFDYQTQKSIELNLPLIIHCREAYPQTIDILKPYKGKARGVFHCFCGTEHDAEEIYNLDNFLFGVGGVITFKNSGAETAKIIAECIDIKNIVLETDSPYITPVPHRGKRNESSFITFTAQKLAEIKNLPLETVAEITTQNAEKLFNI
ncbi:MAG: TatD family hydrolase [Bacteroidales bacterium]|nr:TatD family hydrolase [Bacteroidales bacterium]